MNEPVRCRFSAFSSRWPPHASLRLRELSTGVGGFVGASLSYVGKRRAEFGERYLGGPRDGEIARIPSYTEVDVRAGVDLDRFRLEAYAQNLFDTRGITDAFGFPDPVGGNSFPGGAAGVAIIRPRTIGLTATVNY